MGVAADIVEDPLGPGKRCLGVDDPFHIAQGVQMQAEKLALA